MFLPLWYSKMIGFSQVPVSLLQKFPPQRDSVMYELLSLYFQFWFTKILKALQFSVFIIFWRNLPKTVLKMSLTDVNSVYYLEVKTLKFIHFLLSCKQSFQVRPNRVLKWRPRDFLRRQFENILQKTFFSTYTIYPFLNKRFTVTRYLYIWTYLASHSKSHYKIVR